MSALPPADSLFLVVDDNERLRTRLGRALQDRGYRALTAASPSEARSLRERESPTHAIVDLRMPGGSGLELLEALRAADPTLRVVVLTGYGSIATAVEAMRLGAVNVLAKPADADMVLSAFTPRPMRSEDPGYEPPSLARAEWELINRVLEDCGGNISLAARKLGLHRRTLQRKLQKYPPRD